MEMFVFLHSMIGWGQNILYTLSNVYSFKGLVKEHQNKCQKTAIACRERFKTGEDPGYTREG